MFWLCFCPIFVFRTNLYPAKLIYIIKLMIDKFSLYFIRIIYGHIGSHTNLSTAQVFTNFIFLKLCF